MAFLDLPNEIIIEIVERFERERDICSLMRVNRRLYDLFDDYLYCYDIKYRRSYALFWAAKHGRESTARKLLHLGANVNIKDSEGNRHRGKPLADLTPLHVAAVKGHLAIVKLLLEVGADPEARDRKSLTPLYFALNARHEKVARTISRRISNLQTCLVNSERRLTPLHLSCYLGLRNCALFFLNEGSNVDAMDAKSMTPLHYSLLATIGGGESGPSLDDIFETVKVVLEFGADGDLEGQPRFVGGKPLTARECALAHPQDRIRALFSDSNWNFLQGDFKRKRNFLQIGRPWMLQSTSGMNGTEHKGSGLTDNVNTKNLSDSYHSIRAPEGDQGQSDHLDLSSFPVIDANRPYITSLKTQVSDGPWSPPNADSLIASFSVISETHNPPAAELQVDPFPRLNSLIPKNPIETEAGQLWADFRKSKGQSTAGEPFYTTAKSKLNIRGEEPKTGKKIRWQPLKV